jgi:hypothetical protein
MVETTADKVDPAQMTEAQFGAIAGNPELVQAYALMTVAEASRRTLERGASHRGKAITPGHKLWNVTSYQDVVELVHGRLSEPRLARLVMERTGVYADIYESDPWRVAHEQARNESAAEYKRVGNRFVAQSTSKGHTMSTEPQANQAGTKESKTIGAMMPKADWATARDAVSSRGKTDGKIFLPKPSADYAGKMVFMTDTHLVQQVGKNSAVVHELAKLDNGKDIVQAWDDNKIGPRTNIVVRYGVDRGEAEIIPFNVQRANEVKKQGVEWASANITNEKSRATFVKHLEAFTADMSKGINLQTAKAPIPLRQHDRAPQMERPR